MNQTEKLNRDIQILELKKEALAQNLDPLRGKLPFGIDGLSWLGSHAFSVISRFFHKGKKLKSGHGLFPLIRSLFLMIITRFILPLMGGHSFSKGSGKGKTDSAGPQQSKGQ